MPVYCNPDRIDWYVFIEDRKLPEAEQPRFGLGLPTVAQRNRILQAAAELGEIDADTGKVTGLRLDTSLADVVISAVWRAVENWKDDDGKPVQFEVDERGQASERMRMMIAPGNLMEFMVACLRRMSLMPADRD